MADKTCVYPGSFDPITKGHLDMVQRAAAIFDHVIVAVLRNENKSGMFSYEQRKSMIEKSIEGMDNVTVETFDGLLVEFMALKSAKIILRGLRGPDEFLSEVRMAQLNKMMDPAIETVFLPASEQMSYISSSAAKEIAAFGGNVQPMLPPPAFEAIEAAYENKRKQ